MTTAVETAKLAWWKEPTKDQWIAWWAAWLGKAAEKVVIAPRRWFRNDDPSFNGDSYLTSADLIPSTWLRI